MDRHPHADEVEPMRRQTPYVAVIACLAAWGAVEPAAAYEPDGSTGGVLLQGGVEVHLPTTPYAKLRGADIQVDSWAPFRRSRVPVDQWKPGAPSRIRVADWRTADASRIRVKYWQPFAPARVPVKSWVPGRPSRIRVHGAY